MFKVKTAIALSLISLSIFQQSKAPKPNSSMSYDYMAGVIDDDDTNIDTAKEYASNYLSKAKAEHNHSEIVNGYYYMLHFTNPKHRGIYADSLVLAANKTNDATTIGSAYLTRGIAYYEIKKYSEALANYIVANKYIAPTNDQYLIHKIKFNIAQIKSFLGYNDEAISLLKECVNYYEPEGDMPYLSSLHSLGIAYSKNGDFANSNEINKLGTTTAQAINNTIMEIYFRHSNGVNLFFLGNYKQSIHELLATLPTLIKRDDFANVAVAHFYIGRNYYQLGNLVKALPHFEKVDKALDNGFTRLDFREMYELLIKMYKKENDAEKVLFYINRLYKADRQLAAEHVNLANQIRKGLDTAEISRYKEYATAEIQKRNLLMVATIITCILLLIIIYIAFRKKKATYIAKRDSFINEQPIANTTSQNVKADDTYISPESVEAILKKLKDFENGTEFLKLDMNLTGMMQLFKINSKYIALVIRRYHNRRAGEYINDLKVNHIIKLLKTHKKYREYSLKALSEEGGFGSISRFKRAFIDATSTNPLCYIEQLREASNNENNDLAK